MQWNKCCESLQFFFSLRAIDFIPLRLLACFHAHRRFNSIECYRMLSNDSIYSRWLCLPVNICAGNLLHWNVESIASNVLNSIEWDEWWKSNGFANGIKFSFNLIDIETRIDVHKFTLIYDIHFWRSQCSITPFIMHIRVCVLQPAYLILSWFRSELHQRNRCNVLQKEIAPYKPPHVLSNLSNVQNN